MVTDFSFPDDYDRFRPAPDFTGLAEAVFADGINVRCWPRRLEGDFGEIVRPFASTKGLTSLDEDILLGLDLSPAGRTAADILIADLGRLRSLGLEPELNVINGYPRDDDPGPVARDVLSWHADSATVESDTWLCTYFGPSSEGLRNDHAIRHADIPETRAALLALYGGRDDGGFTEFLSDHCYDLHYAALPHAAPFRFGTGNLWRLATVWPDSRVPPCIHRAPAAGPGELRLLLIS